MEETWKGGERKEGKKHLKIHFLLRDFPGKLFHLFCYACKDSIFFRNVCFRASKLCTTAIFGTQLKHKYVIWTTFFSVVNWANMKKKTMWWFQCFLKPSQETQTLKSDSKCRFSFSSLSEFQMTTVAWSA